MANKNGLPDGVDGIEMAIKIGNVPPLDFHDGTTVSEFKGTSTTLNTGPEGVGKHLYAYTRFFRNGKPRVYGPTSALQTNLLCMDNSVYTKQPNEKKQTGNVFAMKQYWMDKNHPNYAKYAAELDMAATKGEGIIINISWKEVEELHIQALTDRIMVAQHKKDWILNSLYNMHIYFADIPPEERLGEGGNIFVNHKINRWMERLGTNVSTFFFLDDMELSKQLYLAEFTTEDMEEVTNEEGMSYIKVGLEKEQIEKMFTKLFNGGIALADYCYHTGVKPDDYISRGINHLMKGFGFDDTKVTTFKAEDVIAYWETIKD